MDWVEVMDGNQLNLEAQGGYDPDELHGINAAIGTVIRRCRVAKRMSQTTLGEIVGLTFQQVQKYEHGASRISAARLVQFARVFDVAPAFLLKDVPGQSRHVGAEALPAGCGEKESYDEIKRLVSGMSPKTAKLALSVLRLIADNG